MDDWSSLRIWAKLDDVFKVLTLLSVLLLLLFGFILSILYFFKYFILCINLLIN